MALRDFLQPKSSTPISTPALPARRAPGTRIGYDPLLLQRLRADQQRMLELFTQTQALLNTRDYGGVFRKLGELRIVLQDHLMTANVKFYVYMSRQLAHDSAKSAIINDCRREMLVNSRQLMDFLRTYTAVRLDDALAETFQIDLLVIGSVLVQRIEREQTTLFPLYSATA